MSLGSSKSSSSVSESSSSSEVNGTGDDCTSYCELNKTPQAYDVTFPTFTPGLCGAVKCALCSGQTFRCTQVEGEPCKYIYGEALPCSCGSGDCPCFYLGVNIYSTTITVIIHATDNMDPGYNTVIWDAPHISGTTCLGSYTAVHQSGGDHGKPCYCTGNCTVVAVP